MSGVADTSSGLGYSDEIPIDFEPADLPEGAVQDRINAGIVRIIRALTAFEDVAGDPAEEDSPLSHLMVRVEGKLDLLLNLVGGLVHRHVELPRRHRVRVCVGGLEWCDAPDGVAEGATGVIVVYPQPAIPISLRIPGTVTAAGTEGGQRLLLLEYFGLSSEARDLVSKYVFRHHRREIARIRDAQ